MDAKRKDCRRRSCSVYVTRYVLLAVAVQVKDELDLSLLAQLLNKGLY